MREALRKPTSVDVFPMVTLFTRQCHALTGGDPTLGYPAIAKALYGAEGKPLSMTDLPDAANALLVRFGREPLDDTQIREGVKKLAELDLVRVEQDGVSLTSTGFDIADILSKPIGGQQAASGR